MNSETKTASAKETWKYTWRQAVVVQFPFGFIASAMNVCLKARDSLANR